MQAQVLIKNYVHQRKLVKISMNSLKSTLLWCNNDNQEVSD